MWYTGVLLINLTFLFQAYIWGGLYSVDRIFYQLHFRTNLSSLAWYIFAGVLLTFIQWIIDFKYKSEIQILRCCSLKFDKKEYFFTCYPIFLVWCFFPLAFICLPLTILLFGFIFFRLHKGGFIKFTFKFSKVHGLYITILLAALVFVWSFYLQYNAYNSLFLHYQDWCEYAENYWRMAFGDLPWRNYLACAGHWNLLPNIIMSNIIKLFPRPEAIFSVSAILLALSPLLAWKLSETCRLPAGMGIAAAVFAALNPVLINQSLSLFYGYHPILFQIPLILGFFYFWEKHNSIGMYTMILLSLLIQETTAILWLGYGIYTVIIERKLIKGGLLSLLSIAFFSAACYFACQGRAAASQLFHYARLGNSFTEVIFSPITKPIVFINVLFSSEVLSFTLLVILPFAFLLKKSWLLISLLPIYAGIVLQDSPDVKNISMQYGLELTVWILAVVIINSKENNYKNLRSSYFASLITTLICTYFFATLPLIGKCSATHILKRPSAKKAIDFFSNHILPDTRVFTTKRLRSHLLWNTSIVNNISELKIGDSIILDLHDDMEPVESLRRELLQRKDIFPVSSYNWYGRHFIILRKGEPKNNKLPLPFILPQTSLKYGKELPCNNPDYKIRMIKSKNNACHLLIAPVKSVDYEVDIDITLYYPNRKVSRLLVYGEGVCLAGIDKVYYAKLPDPIPISIDVKLKKRYSFGN